MSNTRTILTEVRRAVPTSPDTLEELARLSPTLQDLLQQGVAELTPELILVIKNEVESRQNANTFNNIKEILQGINNNPFYITPSEQNSAEQVSDFENIEARSPSLMRDIDGSVFVDPETNEYILEPDSYIKVETPPKSKPDHIGELTPTDIDVIKILLSDEIKTEREQLGEFHGVSAVSDDGRMGLYGTTVEDLVAIGVVSENAIDDWTNIPENEREDYALNALNAGIIIREVYDNIPYTVRTTLSWYVLSSRRYWLEKLIGPDIFLIDRKIQEAILYRELLRNWKTNFRYFVNANVTQRAQQGAYLMAQKLFGRSLNNLFGIGDRISSIIGRSANAVLDRTIRGIEAGISGRTNTRDSNGNLLSPTVIDTAAQSIPSPSLVVAPSRKFKRFANILTQSTNESLRKVPSTQGYHDPNRIYPRVTHISEPDTNRLARNHKINDTIVGDKNDNRTVDVAVARNADSKWNQPSSPYNAKYPYNHVRESESGHVVELDDTPDNERMHWYHREGTFMEIDRNGTWVRKVVGDGYEIYERDGYIYIAGKANITVDGNCNVYVKTNCNLQVDGNLTADVHKNVTFNVAKNFDVTAGGSINLKAKQNINIDATTINARASRTMKLSGEKTASLAAPAGQASLLSGIGAVVVNGTTLALLPQPGLAAKILAEAHRANAATIGEPPKEKNPKPPAFPPLPVTTKLDEWSAQLSQLSENPEENKNEISAMKKKAVDEGLITKEDLDKPLTIGESDSSAPPALSTNKVAACSMLYGMTVIPLTYRMSKNVTLGMLKNSQLINDQHGLKKQDIVCNLKQLCENVLEPLYALFGQNSILITSVFRYPGYPTGSLRSASGVSFHEQGLALDMCFTNRSFAKYYDAAVEIKKSLQYDKLLLEYRLGDVKGKTTYKPWIHIQWQQQGLNLSNGKTGGNARLQAFTMKNDSRVSDIGTLINLLPNSTIGY